MHEKQIQIDDTCGWENLNTGAFVSFFDELFARPGGWAVN
jgi:hypothetical protein